MRTKVQSIISHWQLADTMSALNVHRTLGKILYMAPLVPEDVSGSGSSNGGPAKRGTRQQKIGLKTITVPDWVIHHLAWWASPAVSQRVSLKIQDTDFTVFTDASTHGWGLNRATTVSVGSCPKLNARTTLIFWKCKPCIVLSAVSSTDCTAMWFTWYPTMLQWYCTSSRKAGPSHSDWHGWRSDFSSSAIANALSSCQSNCRDTAACHDWDGHYPPNGWSVPTCYNQCSTVGDSRGLICSSHSTTRSASSSYLHFRIWGWPTSTLCQSRGTGWAWCMLPTIKNHPNSHSQAQTVQLNHLDTHSSLQNGCIMDAGAFATLTGQTNSHLRPTQTTHSSHSLKREESRNPE